MPERAPDHKHGRMRKGMVAISSGGIQIDVKTFHSCQSGVVYFVSDAKRLYGCGITIGEQHVVEFVMLHGFTQFRRLVISQWRLKVALLLLFSSCSMPKSELRCAVTKGAPASAKKYQHCRFFCNESSELHFLIIHRAQSHVGNRISNSQGGGGQVLALRQRAGAK